MVSSRQEVTINAKDLAYRVPVSNPTRVFMPGHTNSMNGPFHVPVLNMQRLFKVELIVFFLYIYLVYHITWPIIQNSYHGAHWFYLEVNIFWSGKF